MNEFKLDKLEESDPSKWPSWKSAMDTSMSVKGITSSLTSTLPPIEVRNKEAELAYTKSKTAEARLKFLDNEHYDKKSFDENDPLYGEMKSLGNLKDLQAHTKILLDDATRLGAMSEKVNKACYEVMTEVKETVTEHLYRAANLEFRKHKESDVAKGVKEALAKIKAMMTKFPESVVRTIKGKAYSNARPFSNCTTLIDCVNALEGVELEIEEAATELGTPDVKVNKCLIACLKKTYKDTSDDVKAALPNATKTYLEELNEHGPTTFKTVAETLRELTEKHVEEEKKRDRTATDKNEAVGGGQDGQKTAFQAQHKKGIADQKKDMLCGYLPGCRYGDKCMFYHPAGGDRSPSSERRYKDIENSGHSRDRSRDRDRDRDRSRNRDRDRDRDRSRDRDRDRNRDRSRDMDRDRDRDRERSLSRDTARLKTPTNTTRKGNGASGGGGAGGGGARERSSSHRD